MAFMIAVLSQSQHRSLLPVLGTAYSHAPGFAPRIVDTGAIMPKIDQVIPQATQLPILNRLVELVVLGEQDLLWLQQKIGFKSDRNVRYYVEAARWAGLLVESKQIAATALGRRYVATGFDPRVILEGIRGRPLFENVRRRSGGKPPTPAVVENVLRRWSFRYSQGTLVRRANDFCTLFGRVVKEAAEPRARQLVTTTYWCRPTEIPTIHGTGLLWPSLVLCPVQGRECPGGALRTLTALLVTDRRGSE
jgi:hypothetical protein